MAEFVLGVDAAWVEAKPSGVALLAVPCAGNPRLLRIGRSYQEYVEGGVRGFAQWLESPPVGPATIKDVVESACCHPTAPPEVVAIDIPLSSIPITARRAADNAISSQYGGRYKAGTHTPNAQRPGVVSAKMFRELSALGYTWASVQRRGQGSGGRRWFLETYPHPTIIEMLRLPERLQYKVDKVSKYWPSLSAASRLGRVAEKLDALRSGLVECIRDGSNLIPIPSRLLERAQTRHATVLKGLEDALDAVVCGYVAIKFLTNRATPFGDSVSTIWV